MWYYKIEKKNKEKKKKMSFIRKTTSMLSLSSMDKELDDRIKYFLVIDGSVLKNTFKNQTICKHCGMVDVLLGTFSESSGQWEWDRANFKHQDMDSVLDFIKIYGEIKNEYDTRICKNNFIEHASLTKNKI